MCGIVGTTAPPLATQAAGPSPTVRDVLLRGLYQLEYRGYDSAGIAFLGGVAPEADRIHESQIRIYKQVGRVEALRAELPPDADGRTGIAHTRWATHGAVTQANAHPHRSWDGRVAIVHNGIIDNAAALRVELLGAGIPLAGQTDTELLAHLVARELAGAAAGDPLAAVRRTLERVQGTWGLVVAFADHVGQLVCARMGSPMAVGRAEGAGMVASDPVALQPWLDRVAYLDDGDVALLTDQAIHIERPGAGRVERALHALAEGHRRAPLTAGHRSYLHQEILEQPAALERCLAGRLPVEQGLACLGGLGLAPAELARLPSATLLACGTSLHAAEVGAMLLESLAGLPARAELASEYVARDALVDPDALHLALSQSGETWDTLAATRLVQERGGQVHGIVNVPGSSLARACGRGVHLHAGPEVAVASTKAFTVQVAALALVALQLGRTRRLSHPQGRALAAALAAMPGQVATALDRLEADPALPAVARRLSRARAVVFIGRGVSWPVAREGALKLQELSWLPCQAHAAGELKHGPLALVDADVPVIAVVPDDACRQATLHNVAEARSRGAPVVVLHSDGDTEAAAGADHAIALPRAGHPLLSPLLTVLPLQLLAWRVARAMQRDVDRPRNLAKAVTVG